MRRTLTAALTPPPVRPKGADAITEALGKFPGRLAGIRDIAEHLAENGIRAGGDS